MIIHKLKKSPLWRVTTPLRSVIFWVRRFFHIAKRIPSAIREFCKIFYMLIKICCRRNLLYNSYGIPPIDITRNRVNLNRLFSVVLYPLNKESRKAFRQNLESNKKSFVFSTDFNPSTIPVYVISFNRLSYLKQMIEWLEKFNFTNINIIDNNSSYPPLLEYLKSSRHAVHYMEKNYGHRVFWTSGYFDDVLENSLYIVTDPDLAFNENLKIDFLYEMYRLLGEYSNITKIGFALKKDDIPESDTNLLVKQWEKQFWEKRLEDKLEIYRADVDTTFALYRHGKPIMDSYEFYSAIRVAGNYTAKHLPWYKTESQTEEDEYYLIHSNSESATWAKNLELYRNFLKGK